MSSLQPDIQQEINKLQNTSGYVELFKLDASAFGGPIYLFTNQQAADGGYVSFGGIAYTPIPIYAQGFDVTSTGTQPKPTLTISNVNKTLLAAVVGMGDLVGAKVTRIRTYEKFLDDGATPNSAAFTADKWLVEHTTTHDCSGIQWSLTTQLDRFGLRFGRQCLKDQSIKNLYCPGISRTRV